MPFTLTPTVPVPDTTLAILGPDGERLGEMKITANDRGSSHHATFQLGGYHTVCAGLAQGFGNTPDEAITDAITRGRVSAADYAAGVECLAIKLGYKP